MTSHSQTDFEEPTNYFTVRQNISRVLKKIMLITSIENGRVMRVKTQ